MAEYRTRWVMDYSSSVEYGPGLMTIDELANSHLVRSSPIVSAGRLFPATHTSTEPVLETGTLPQPRSLSCHLGTFACLFSGSSDNDTATSVNTPS